MAIRTMRSRTAKGKSSPVPAGRTDPLAALGPHRRRLDGRVGQPPLDAASIFIAAQHEGKKQIPLTVVAAGNRARFSRPTATWKTTWSASSSSRPPLRREGPDRQPEADFRAIPSINGNGFGGYGEVVFGTKGTLILEREQEAMIFKDSDTDSKPA